VVVGLSSFQLAAVQNGIESGSAHQRTPIGNRFLSWKDVI